MTTGSPRGGGTVHATALAFGEAGLLLRGPSGAGKSTLALALLGVAARAGRFARLVADDRVALAARGGRLIARAPAPIAGLVELSGAGILPAAALPAVRLSLAVDLVAAASIPRLPEPSTVVLEGVALPRLLLPARAADVAVVSLSALLLGDGLTPAGSRSQRATVTVRPSEAAAPLPAHHRLGGRS